MLTRRILDVEISSVCLEFSLSPRLPEDSTLTRGRSTHVGHPTSMQQTILLSATLLVIHKDTKHRCQLAVTFLKICFLYTLIRWLYLSDPSYRSSSTSEHCKSCIEQSDRQFSAFPDDLHSPQHTQAATAIP